MTPSLTGVLGLADSRFADELARGTLGMTFPPELEREYHAFFLTERRSHVRSFNMIMCTLATSALLMSWLSYGATDGSLPLLRLGAIALAYACMLWAACSRHCQRVYLTTARVASLA